jgi:hypothetical protein
MRVLKRNPWLVSLGALLAMTVATARVASADASADRGGSIIVFPKVISDGTRDTLIQISNINNTVVFAHCMYLDASPEIPGVPVGPGNPRRCVERDFTLTLTRQQPTVWRVSTGRLLNNFDQVTGACQTVNVLNADRQTCPGIDPGNVINVGTLFEGHLVCVQTDSAGAPVGGDALKGEAFIESVDAAGLDGLISAYNAVSISQGTDGPNTDSILQLDGVEYAQCPDALRFTHLAEGVEDPVVEGVTATTELTLVPCTIDYESQTPPQVTLQFGVWDDTELFQSTATTLDCWFNEDLSDIGSLWNPLRSTTYQTQVRASTGLRCRGGNPETEYQFCTDDDQCDGGLCLPSSGLLGVAETFRVTETGDLTGSSAINLHNIGTRESDTIFLQTGILGVCDDGANSGNPCTGDMECPGGACVAP